MYKGFRKRKKIKRLLRDGRRQTKIFEAKAGREQIYADEKECCDIYGNLIPPQLSLLKRSILLDFLGSRDAPLPPPHIIYKENSSFTKKNEPLRNENKLCCWRW